MVVCFSPQVHGDVVNESLLRWSWRPALTHLKYKLAAARIALWQENFSSWTLRTTSVRQWSRRSPWSSAWIFSERFESLKITLSSSSRSWGEMFNSPLATELSVCTGESELFSTESLIVSSFGAEINPKKCTLGLRLHSLSVTVGLELWCVQLLRCFLFSF